MHLYIKSKPASQKYIFCFLGGYGGITSQVTAGGVHHSNPPMLSVDNQAGYGAGPAPSQDFQSFNMQGKIPGFQQVC